MAAIGCYHTPLGYLVISSQHDCVTSIRLTDCPDVIHTPSPVTDLAAGEIAAYLSGSLKQFSFSINPEGTAFQRLVWQALLQIPYGETRTYAQIAELIGNPRAARAVGAACNRNPIWIAIPCHRVVGSSGQLTGYAGGLDRKEELLKLEALHK